MKLEFVGFKMIKECHKYPEEFQSALQHSEFQLAEKSPYNSRRVLIGWQFKDRHLPPNLRERRERWIETSPHKSFIIGRCLSENTEIFIEENDKPVKISLKEIYNKYKDKMFKTYSLNFRKKKVENDEAVIIDSGEQEVYEIKLDGIGKKVFATENHKFFIQENENIVEKNLKDIKIGDKIILVCSSSISWKNKESRMKRIEKLKITKKDLWKSCAGWNKKPHIIKKCIICEKEIDTYPCFDKIRKYCSRKCRNEGRKGKVSWNKGLIGKEYSKHFKNGFVNFMKGKHHSKETRKKISLANSGINNGFYGKHHTKITKDMISSSKKGKMIGINNPSFGKIFYPKLTFIKSLNHSVRSSWETEIGYFLKYNNIQYKYENKKFVVQNNGTTHTYTPDFELIENRLYLEVKGPIFDWQVHKLDCFIKQYPNICLVLVINNRKRYLEKFNEIKSENLIIKTINDKEGVLKCIQEQLNLLKK